MNLHMAGRNILLAILASAIASLAVVLIQVMIMWTSWPEYVKSPDYLFGAAEMLVWYFTAAFLACALVLAFSSKKAGSS
jgi:hypothetical protein